MAHIEQSLFIEGVKKSFPEYFWKQKVLEVGSLNINGSVRRYFDDCDYTGIDVAPGRDVDFVCQGQHYDALDQTFGVSISCECFEHNPEWVGTFRNMHRMTKTGGIILMTCATTGRPEHGTTRVHPNCSPLTISIGWDYYKNLTSKDFAVNFDLDSMFSSFYFGTHLKAHDLYFYGIVRH
jgi:SAM-dependent methyltransferase